jgi:hypothetical protein
MWRRCLTVQGVGLRAKKSSPFIRDIGGSSRPKQGFKSVGYTVKGKIYQ